MLPSPSPTVRPAPRAALAFLLLSVPLSALSACATEPVPGDDADDLAGPAPADELVSRGDRPPPLIADGPIADVRRPTADGRASYRFQFLAAEGVVATIAETPGGYPEPLIPSECALDTFLRVAADDALVPDELRRFCGHESAGAGARRVAELRKPGGELELAPAGAARGSLGIAAVPSLCTSTGYANRLTDLRAAASYRPSVPDCTCNFGAAWNNTGCAWVDGDGDIISQCEPADYFFFLSQAPAGFYCLPGHTTCEPVPDPACAHTWQVYDDNDNGNWSAWQRFSTGADQNTETRVYFAACDASPVTGYWRMREQSTDPWGQQHPFSISGSSTGTVHLSGPVSGGDYVGWDFFVRLDGDNFQVASAWVYMEGRDASDCPMNL